MHEVFVEESIHLFILKHKYFQQVWYTIKTDDLFAHSKQKKCYGDTSPKMFKRTCSYHFYLLAGSFPEKLGGIHSSRCLGPPRRCSGRRCAGSVSSADQCVCSVLLKEQGMHIFTYTHKQWKHAVKLMHFFCIKLLTKKQTMQVLISKLLLL